MTLHGGLPRILMALLSATYLVFKGGLTATGAPNPPTDMYVTPGVKFGEIAVVCTTGSARRPCALKPIELIPQIHNVDGNPVQSSGHFIPWAQAARENRSGESVGFKLIQGDLKSGMYHAVVYLPQSLRSNESRSENTAFLTFSIPNPVYVPPSLRLGQTFIALAPEGTLNKSAGSENNRNTDGLHATDLGSLFTITRIEEQTGQMVVTLKNERGQVLRTKTTGDVESLPNLVPLVKDPELQRIREAYESGRVWGHGGLHAECAISSNEGGGVSTSGKASFRVRRIIRVYGQAAFNLGYDGPSNFESDASFEAMNPLIVLFDGPAGNDVQSSEHWTTMQSSLSGLPLLPPRPIALERTRCIAFYAIKADAWDLERTYSTIPVQAAHPKWPRYEIEAIYSHQVLPGMTHDMVAWSRGYPSAWGTIKQLNALDAWRYPSTPPFHFWVYFRGGKVIKFAPDGRLP